MTHLDLAPPVDPRTAYTVTTAAVASALIGWSGAVEHGGVHYEIAGPVRSHPGPLDGLVTFTLTDGTSEHAIAVQLMVGAEPLPRRQA